MRKVRFIDGEVWMVVIVYDSKITHIFGDGQTTPSGMDSAVFVYSAVNQHDDRFLDRVWPGLCCDMTLF